MEYFLIFNIAAFAEKGITGTTGSEHPAELKEVKKNQIWTPNELHQNCEGLKSAATWWQWDTAIKMRGETAEKKNPAFVIKGSEREEEEEEEERPIEHP